MTIKNIGRALILGILMMLAGSIATSIYLALFNAPSGILIVQAGLYIGGLIIAIISEIAFIYLVNLRAEQQGAQLRFKPILAPTLIYAPIIIWVLMLYLSVIKTGMHMTSLDIAIPAVAIVTTILFRILVLRQTLQASEDPLDWRKVNATIVFWLVPISFIDRIVSNQAIRHDMKGAISNSLKQQINPDAQISQPLFEPMGVFLGILSLSTGLVLAYVWSKYARRIMRGKVSLEEQERLLIGKQHA